jgi:NAD(P)-dependent dehydrogenase (short-subunit alcohol dehydrogenase family)
MQISNQKKEEDNMKDKIVLITGGTDGIGRETALGLAKLGATVVVVGHNMERGEAAIRNLQKQSGNERVYLMLADLTNMAQVRKLAATFEQKYGWLDVLVNNAISIHRKREETPDGFERTFAIGHLSPFLLTNLLLPLLKASAPSRIVNMTSDGHKMTELDFDDLQSTKWYRGVDIYMRAKLANLLFTYELARRLEGTGVTVNAAEPGSANTTMMKATKPDMLPPMIRVIWPMIKRTLGTPAQAAVVPIHLASSPDLESVSGQYIGTTLKPVKSSDASYDPNLARRLWDVSAEMVRLPANENIMPA